MHHRHLLLGIVGRLDRIKWMRFAQQHFDPQPTQLDWKISGNLDPFGSGQGRDSTRGNVLFCFQTFCQTIIVGRNAKLCWTDQDGCPTYSLTLLLSLCLERIWMSPGRREKSRAARYCSQRNSPKFTCSLKGECQGKPYEKTGKGNHRGDRMEPSAVAFAPRTLR